MSFSGVKGQLVVQYDVDRSSLPSQILVNDGYFAHYFAPEELKPLPKHVTFALDISGSMGGRKIAQLKEGMEKILGDLHQDDYFNTNIHGAMMTATNISQLGKKIQLPLVEDRMPSLQLEPIIIFLTDGQPTCGICDKNEIVNEVTRVNQIGKASIFALGFGNDVEPNSLTRKNFITFFHGSELIVSGRIDPLLAEKEFHFRVTGTSTEGTREFQPRETQVLFFEKTQNKTGFMERLWAYLTIQQLLDEEKRFDSQMALDKKHEVRFNAGLERSDVCNEECRPRGQLFGGAPQSTLFGSQQQLAFRPLGSSSSVSSATGFSFGQSASTSLSFGAPASTGLFGIKSTPGKSNQNPSSSVLIDLTSVFPQKSDSKSEEECIRIYPIRFSRRDACVDVKMNSILLLLATFMVSRLTGPHKQVHKLETANLEDQHSIVILPLKTLSHHVQCSIRYRYAKTTVSSKVYNPSRESQEAVFTTVLPETAFISSFVMNMDEIEYTGFVKEKLQAKHKFPKGTPKKKSTHGDGLSYFVNLDPGEVVEDFVVSVDIRETSGIETFNVSPLMLSNGKDLDLKEVNNLYEALKTAFLICHEAKKHLQRISNNNHVDRVTHTQPMVVLLTDGVPKVGELDVHKIFKRTRRWNAKTQAAIFALAIGDKANLEFLKRLSQDNSGFAVRVHPNSNVEVQLVDYYRRLSAPLLSNIVFTYNANQVNASSLTGTRFGTFFSGSEIVVAGKLLETMAGINLRYTVVGQIENSVEPFYPQSEHAVVDHGIENKPGLLERLWAYLRIQKTLDGGNCMCGKKQAATAMAVKYSFVTPVTSMVLVRPDGRMLPLLFNEIKCQK
ncbi:hypothetical protein C0J52_04775 [Blattella germanica]|nr:hypothetical protein C0J52_04775 [Blattella germanica]